jgi:RNA-directed DNA polymerase
VAEAILEGKTSVSALDLTADCETLRPHQGVARVAQRSHAAQVLPRRTVLLTAAGQPGIPQGAVPSPLISTLSLNEVARMLARAKAVTRSGKRTAVESCRFADDLVVLSGPSPRQRQELARLQVEVNERQSPRVDLTHGERCGFLGGAFRRIRTPKRRWRPLRTPLPKKRTALLRTRKEVFRRHRARPLKGLIEDITPLLRGWGNSCAIGHSRRCFSCIRHWVEQKMRRHLAKAPQRQGLGWKRWHRRWRYDGGGLVDASDVKRQPSTKAAPVGSATSSLWRSVQARVVRESRMRRAMWRELETWAWWNCAPTAQIESMRVDTLHLQQARQFSTLPGESPLRIVSSPPIIVSVHEPRHRLIGLGTPIRRKNFP